MWKVQMKRAKRYIHTRKVKREWKTDCESKNSIWIKRKKNRNERSEQFQWKNIWNSCEQNRCRLQTHKWTALNTWKITVLQMDYKWLWQWYNVQWSFTIYSHYWKMFNWNLLLQTIALNFNHMLIWMYEICQEFSNQQQQLIIVLCTTHTQI